MAIILAAFLIGIESSDKTVTPNQINQEFYLDVLFHTNIRSEKRTSKLKVFVLVVLVKNPRNFRHKLKLSERQLKENMDLGLNFNPKPNLLSILYDFVCVNNPF